MAQWVGPYMNPKVNNTSTAPAQVEQKFSQAEAYARTALAEATDYMGTLSSLLTALQKPGVEKIDSIQIPALNEGPTGTLPSMGTVGLPSIPDDQITEPQWEKVEDIHLPDVPNFDDQAPNMDIGSLPDVTNVTMPADIPSITTPDMPSAPDLNVPDAPTLPGIDFPSPPSVTIPTFEMDLPNVDWDLPQNFNYADPAYTSDIWASLLHKVLTNIENGGTGLEPAVEQDLYNRAIARQEIENERMYTEAENYFAARGFNLPPGALSGRLAEISREISRNNTDLSEKITISQAELAQKNTQFFVDKGIQLEGILRDFFDKQAQRAFQASVENARIGIEIVNAAINTYNSKIEKYKAYAATFEARVRAALLVLEGYRTQVETCGIKAEVQKNLLAIYTTQLEALRTKVDLYATQMKAVGIKTEVERTAIEAYRAQVQAYATTMEGNRIKYEVFNSKVKAKMTEVEAYSERVKAFIARVEALNIKADVAYKKAGISLQKNQLKADTYKAKLAGYLAKVKAVSEEGQMKLRSYQEQILAHTADREDYVAKNKIELQRSTVDIENARLKLQRAIASVQASLESIKAINGLQIEGTKGIMNVAAQLAASAMNSVTASAHIGATNATSASDSFTHNASIYESHPYKEIE